MSKSRYITLSPSILIYNVLFEHLENLLDENSSNFYSCLKICVAVKEGYKKLKLYYIRTDKSNIYPIVTSK